MQTNLKGSDTVDVMPLHLSIGAVYMNLKRFTEAYDCFEVAYNILKQLLGEDDPTTKDLKNTMDSLLELNLVKKK